MNDQRKQFYDTIYNTKRWKRLRLLYINSDPLNALCECCYEGHKYCCSGMTATEAATISGYGRKVIESMWIVDHQYPLVLGGDAWSFHNLRSYCLKCHSRKTQRIDSMLKKKLKTDRLHEDLENFD